MKECLRGDLVLDTGEDTGNRQGVQLFMGRAERREQSYSAPQVRRQRTDLLAYICIVSSEER